MFVRQPTTIHRLARSRLSRSARAENKGAFLADAAAEGFTPSSSVKVRFEAADERAAGYLAIEPGTELTARDRVMRANALVVQLAVSRLPRGLTSGTTIEQVDTGPGGVYARLEDGGHRIVSYAEHVASRMPAPHERSTMQLPAGTPVLTITRVAYGTDRPLEMNDIVLPADRYELSHQWPAG